MRRNRQFNLQRIILALFLAVSLFSTAYLFISRRSRNMTGLALTGEQQARHLKISRIKEVICDLNNASESIPKQ
jgi:hypothetical protein